ncbi:adhesive plaque matrix protein-like isoform X2 [Daphnia carinata]|uniref:adhesive plaque matrix protein-like isoform X2 n=1 Tax=Daphnia carinata TaxID=120202 RepID=UPI00257BD494|nr:adhesive plaque matrix protein-like isoform X2 [Daphnia carinata]
MGLQSSRSLTMVLSLYVMLMAINWTCASIQYRMFDAVNPFTFGGLRNAILHRQLQQEQASESVSWPKFIPLNQGQRNIRQFQHVAGSSSFIPLGNLEVEHRAVDHPAPIQQQYEVQNSTPAPQTESPIVYRPYTPPVPQPLPPPYISPAQQSASAPAPYNPFTAPPQPTTPAPAPYNPFTAPPQPTTPAPVTYNPYNTPPPLPTPIPTPFSPYIAPNPQPQPIPAPFPPHIAPVQQPQPAPTPFTPYSAPVQQHQPVPIPFTPYNSPAPQPTPFAPSDASGTYSKAEQIFSNHQSYQSASQPEPVANARSPYEAAETQGPYGPPEPTEQFSVFQEMARQNLISWPDNYVQQQPAQARNAQYPTPQQVEHHRSSYASSRNLNFEPSYNQFAKRSLESPPSPLDLGFPSISSTAENWNMDVDWSIFAGKRKRRSAQRPSRDHGRRKIIEDYDNIAIEGRQASETRVPAPSSRSAPSKREGSKQEYKQEYDGPYVYTQLFGPPYEVGYIRSPIPSKHVYEDYLQFVRSWSAASRDAVDDQLRANPAAAKEYSSVKYKENTPAYKETSQKDSYKEPEYKETTPAYKESAPAYKEPAPAYSEPEYKAPSFKGPSQSYKEPAYTETDYKEPAYKEPAYKDSTPAYKEPAYKESAPAYKEPEYKAPPFKGPSPSYKEPAYTETDYKEPGHKQPAYKEPAYSKEPEYKAPAYSKEPEYKEPAYSKEPEYKEPAYSKEPEYKEPAYSKEPEYKEPAYSKEPEYKEPAYSKEPEYKEPAYKEPAAAYKEPAYQAPTPAYSEPAYKEAAPAYKEPEYKDPAPAYKEPAYKEPAYNKEPEYKEPAYKEPEYKEPAYKEESYKEAPRTDRPVFRDEIHYRETPHKETAHKSAYKGETYEAPKINYHSPQSDYVAPESEFRPTSKPYEAAGPKSPVYMERDFIPIKSQAANYDTPTTTYRTTTTYNDAPLSYDILKAFEKARPSANAYPPTAVYEPVTAKYKAPEALYDSPTQGYDTVTTKYKATEAPYEAPKYEQSAYEAPKRYIETPPVRDYLPAKKYENPPARTSPSAAYYKPPNRYVEPPVHGSKYEAPAAYETPAKYSEPAYEAPKTYDAPAYPATNKPDAYAVEKVTTPAYKESYPADDYAPSGYKDDVELSSTSYQAVSKNYDNPSDDYAQPPVAYDQVKKTEESYASASYDETKKDDTYGADAGSSPSYEAPKKKHYPVIIGRYQVTDSSAFLPKKVGGGESSTGVKSVGSQVHGSNGDEYVVYYLPYGQPLPVPVRRRRHTDDSQPIYTIRRLRSLADRQRHSRKLNEERQQEQQVLTPEEVHEQFKYSFLNAKTDETSTESVEDVTRTTADVRSQEEFLSHESEPKKDDTFPADGLKNESPLVDEMIVAQIEEDLTKSSVMSEIVPQTSSRPTDDKPAVEEPVGEIIIVKVPAENQDERVIVAVDEVSVTHAQVDVTDEPTAAYEEGGVANVDFVPVQQDPFTSDVSFNTKEIKKYSIYDKKKNPAIFKQSILPGLTQKPIGDIRPSETAAESKEHWNGYSTWWTKLGYRVAKHYNYE